MPNQSKWYCVSVTNFGFSVAKLWYSKRRKFEKYRFENHLFRKLLDTVKCEYKQKLVPNGIPLELTLQKVGEKQGPPK